MKRSLNHTLENNKKEGKMKTISIKRTACLVISGLLLSAMASELPALEEKHVPTVQFVTMELVAGTMFGVLGTVASYKITSTITGTRFGFMESGSMSPHCFCFSTLSGYILGASFGTYITAKSTVPTVSFGKHLLCGMSCAGIGLALLHSGQRDVQSGGALLIVLGPLLAPSTYGVIKKLEYEKISLIYQPLLYEKKIVHGLVMKIVL